MFQVQKPNNMCIPQIILLNSQENNTMRQTLLNSFYRFKKLRFKEIKKSTNTPL